MFRRGMYAVNTTTNAKLFFFDEPLTDTKLPDQDYPVYVLKGSYLEGSQIHWFHPGYLSGD